MIKLLPNVPQLEKLNECSQVWLASILKLKAPEEEEDRGYKKEKRCLLDLFYDSVTQIVSQLSEI